MWYYIAFFFLRLSLFCIRMNMQLHIERHLGLVSFIALDEWETYSESLKIQLKITLSLNTFFVISYHHYIIFL